jgi:hypothetical protein
MAIAKQGALISNTLFRSRFLEVAALISFILPVIFLGSVITYDGHQYLASAKELLSGGVDQHYFLARTPGYPLILAAVSIVPGSTLWTLLFFQSLAMASSSYFLLRQVGKIALDRKILSSRSFNVIALFVLVQIQVIGYSSAVLQQAWFVVYTNLAIGLILYNPQKTLSRFFGWSLLFLAGSLVSPALNLISLGVALLLVVQVRRESKLEGTKVIVLFFLLFLPVALFDYSWNQFVMNVKKESPSANYARTPGISDFAKIPTFINENPLKALESWQSAYVTQSGLVPSLGWQGVVNVPSSPLYENRIHSTEGFLQSRPCGFVDETNYGKWVGYSEEFLTPKCRIMAMPTPLFITLYCISILTGLAWLTFLPIAILMIAYFRRNKFHFRIREMHLALFIPPTLIVLSHILLGAQADRYIVSCIQPLLIMWFISLNVLLKKPTDQKI